MLLHQQVIVGDEDCVKELLSEVNYFVGTCSDGMLLEVMWIMWH